MVELNHTIVHARDREASAAFLSDILGLPAPRPFGPFLVVDTATGVSLDYIATDEAITIEHYAFLVTETEFDDGRIKARGLDYWADPRLAHKGEINRITAAAAAISSTRRGAIWRSWRGLMGPVDSRRRC